MNFQSEPKQCMEGAMALGREGIQWGALSQSPRTFSFRSTTVGLVDKLSFIRTTNLHFFAFPWTIRRFVSLTDTAFFFCTPPPPYLPHTMNPPHSPFPFGSASLCPASPPVSL